MRRPPCCAGLPAEKKEEHKRGQEQQITHARQNAGFALPYAAFHACGYPKPTCGTRQAGEALQGTECCCKCSCAQQRPSEKPG